MKIPYKTAVINVFITRVISVLVVLFLVTPAYSQSLDDELLLLEKELDAPVDTSLDTELDLSLEIDPDIEKEMEESLDNEIDAANESERRPSPPDNASSPLTLDTDSKSAINTLLQELTQQGISSTIVSRNILPDTIISLPPPILSTTAITISPTPPIQLAPTKTIVINVLPPPPTIHAHPEIMLSFDTLQFEPKDTTPFNGFNSFVGLNLNHRRFGLLMGVSHRKNDNPAPQVESFYHYAPSDTWGYNIALSYLLFDYQNTHLELNIGQASMSGIYKSLKIKSAYCSYVSLNWLYALSPHFWLKIGIQPLMVSHSEFEMDINSYKKHQAITTYPFDSTYYFSSYSIGIRWAPHFK